MMNLTEKSGFAVANYFVSSAIAVLSMTFLLACGGGGSVGGDVRGNGGEGTSLAHLPHPLIANTESARLLVDGEVSPFMTSQAIEQELQSVATDADTLLISDVFVSASWTENPTEVEVTCADARCRGSFQNGVILVDHSIDNFGVTLDDSNLSTSLHLDDFTDQYTSVMIHRGVTLGQARAAGRFTHVMQETFQFQNYGGWLDETVFAVQSEAVLSDTYTFYYLFAYSVGNGSGTNPSGMGAASWAGVMIGSDKGSGHVVHGDAKVDIDNLELPEIDVAFTSIRDLSAGGSVADMNWDGIGLGDGSFRDTGGTIEGAFYGMDHVEVGGIFNNAEIIGAFGARRQ